MNGVAGIGGVTVACCFFRLLFFWGVYHLWIKVYEYNLTALFFILLTDYAMLSMFFCVSHSTNDLYVCVLTATFLCVLSNCSICAMFCLVLLFLYVSIANYVRTYIQYSFVWHLTWHSMLETAGLVVVVICSFTSTL